MAKSDETADVLYSFLEEERVATLTELKSALNTTGTMTVFRRLKPVLFTMTHDVASGGPESADRSLSWREATQPRWIGAALIHVSGPGSPLEA